MSKGGLRNPDWMKEFQPERKTDVDKVRGESAELYELKCLSRTDINLIRAKRWFERPPYYKRFSKEK